MIQGNRRMVLEPVYNVGLQTALEVVSLASAIRLMIQGNALQKSWTVHYCFFHLPSICVAKS